MKSKELIEAEQDLLSTSYMEAIIALCDDLSDFIMDHAYDELMIEGKARKNLEMLCCVNELKKTLDKYLNLKQNGNRQI